MFKKGGFQYREDGMNSLFDAAMPLGILRNQKLTF